MLLFGGSFDPLHHGHLIVCRYIAEHFGVTQVVLVPSASPPHKQDRVLAAATDRLAMCRLAAADDPQLAVSDFEIGQPGPNYTLYTVEHFRGRLGGAAELYWLIGMDTLHELGTWHRAGELVDACTIVTAARPGFERPHRSALGGCFPGPQIQRLQQHIVEGPRIDIAGTDIRARVRAGLSVRYLVPEVVRRYIDEHGLYRSA